MVQVSTLRIELNHAIWLVALASFSSEPFTVQIQKTIFCVLFSACTMILNSSLPPKNTLPSIFISGLSIATFYLTSLFPSNITGRLICSQPRELNLPFPLSPILQPLWLIYFLVLVAGSWFKSILSLQPTIEKKHSFRYSQWQFPQQHALAIKTKGVDQNCPGEIQ